MKMTHLLVFAFYGVQITLVILTNMKCVLLAICYLGKTHASNLGILTISSRIVMKHAIRSRRSEKCISRSAVEEY